MIILCKDFLLSLLLKEFFQLMTSGHAYGMMRCSICHL